MRPGRPGPPGDPAGPAMIDPRGLTGVREDSTVPPVPVGPAGRRVELAARRWIELDGVAEVTLLVPVGSLEQHGPHLPLSTDADVATEVARRAAARLGAEGIHALCAPTIGYGASGEHQDFPGTISIGHQALELLLVELARSACRWAGTVVVVNGHGGNSPTVVRAVTRLRAEGRDVRWVACAVVGGDAHAGHAETSIMLSLDPLAVGPEWSPGLRTPITEILPALREHGVRALSPSGVLGDPRSASAATGRRMLELITQRVVQKVLHGPDQP